MWARIFRRAGVLAGVLVLLGSGALAQPVQVLDNQHQPVVLAGAARYWIDASGALETQTVAARSDLDWKPAPPSGIYSLQPRQALWLRFTVAPPLAPDNWLLEIPYAALDRASLYTPDSPGQWTEQRAGDLTPVSQWTTPHRHPLLLVQFPAGTPTQYLLRLENAQGFSAPIRFVTARYVLREEQRASIFLGACFGLALLGWLVGVVGLLWLNDSAYFFYGLCAVLIGLTQAASSGVAGLLLWPNAAYWADRSLVVMGVLALVVFLQLNASVVYLAQRSRRLNNTVWAAVVTGLVLCALLLLTPSAIRLSLTVPYLLLVLVLVVTTNLWAWRHGDRFSGWLLLSCTPFAVGLALAVARYVQWIPLSLATENGVMVSMTLQLVSLLAVLAVRSQHRRENRRRLQGLDRIDPATGLINEQVFAERLARMMARSERLRHHSAVLMIDIVNIEQTKRDFGRKAASELPLRVAARLLSTARDIDSAARLSERRFGMLVEGSFTAAEAATLGPRIVARCLMPYEGLHADCIAKVRVAYALVPEQGNNAHHLMHRLQERLACAPGNDKRAVYSLAEAAPCAKPDIPAGAAGAAGAAGVSTPAL